MTSTTARSSFGRLLAGSAPVALTIAALASPAHAIVPNDNNTPAEAVDTEGGVNGVGAVITNVPGQGTVGVCTGTLINPRTVLFAAHCVNTRPATDYNGTNVRASVAFDVNALPGIQSWFGNSQTNAALFVYNINRVYWNPASVQRPQSLGFLEGDIAIASLDTPASNVPTWALLFSPLPTPDSIDPVTGTGYHVNITGYGRSGSGTAGATQGIDFRRRAAENMLGALGSLDDRNTFLFGAPSGLPQVLYSIDFDDPNKTSPFDFNLFKDEPLENEGTTAGGDSGGPLILDAANNDLHDQDLVIGVLSGGSRFFGPQAFSSYGTQSFYQPLFLYWDWIAANNPYRYVTAKAGNGKWEDASHWETTLDPAYMIINGSGAVVNGIPTSPGNGINGTEPSFGEVCFDPEGAFLGDECVDLATGNTTPPARNDTGADLVSGIGVAEIDIGGHAVKDGSEEPVDVERVALLADLNQAQSGAPIMSEEQPHGPAGGAPEFAAGPNPAPTLANGLPGATGFVPDNVDPVVSANAALNRDPRYYDVTLSRTGTTELGSTVEIDRLSVLGSAGLFIGNSGDLTSLIDISQLGGNVRVNGNLRTNGDYTLFAGLLGGTGTVTTPFLTSIAGVISPDVAGRVGTLTVNGNVVLASGSTMLVDIGSGNASDRLVVTGAANVGGVVALGGLTNQINGTGTTYTILTAGGGVTGQFVNGTISPILSQSFIYNPTSVQMRINAASYLTVVDPNDPVQTAYAQLLDTNRTATGLAEVYLLDYQDATTIQRNLAGLAPTTETAVRTLATQSFDHLVGFHSNRLATSNRASAGGTIATIGNPVETVAASFDRFAQPGSAAAMSLAGDEGDMHVTEGALPDNLAIYLAGGLINGDGDSMPGFQTVKTDFTGHFIAAGVEVFPSDNSMFGASVYHSVLDADVALGHTADSKLWAWSIYGQLRTKPGLVIDGQFNLGSYNVETERDVVLLGVPQNLTSDADASTMSASLGLSYDIPVGSMTLSPGGELRYADMAYGQVLENGGTTALAINREDYESLQGRVGLDLKSKSDAMVRLHLRGDYVHEFEDGPQVFSAGFRAGTSAPVTFALDGTDTEWFEVGFGASVGKGPIQFGVAVDSTLGRSNAKAQVYSAQATLKF